MGLFSNIFTGVTGGVIDKAIDTAKEYFPPDMSEAERAQFELKMKQIQHEIDMQAQQAANEAEKQLTERVALLEGTASDLQAFPFLGRIVVFMRGLQRPVWGFATMYLDFMWFTAWMNLSDRQEQALIVINFLVLGFLFGERAIKNVGPIMQGMFSSGRKHDPG